MIDLANLESYKENNRLEAKVPDVLFPDVIRKEDVNVVEIEGKKIIAIEIREAEAGQIPVYIKGDPYQAYFRNGDGDYLLDPEDVERMVRIKYEE